MQPGAMEQRRNSDFAICNGPYVFAYEGITKRPNAQQFLVIFLAIVDGRSKNFRPMPRFSIWD